MADRKTLRNLLRVLRYLDDMHEKAYLKLRAKEVEHFEPYYVSRTKIADDLKINYDTLNEIIFVLQAANVLTSSYPADGSVHIALVQEWRDSFFRDAICSGDIKDYYGLEADPKPMPQDRVYRRLMESSDGGFLIPITDDEALKAPFELVVKSKKGSFTVHVDPADES